MVVEYVYRCSLFASFAKSTIEPPSCTYASDCFIAREPAASPYLGSASATDARRRVRSPFFLWPSAARARCASSVVRASFRAAGGKPNQRGGARHTHGYENCHLAETERFAVLISYSTARE